MATPVPGKQVLSRLRVRAGGLVGLSVATLAALWCGEVSQCTLGDVIPLQSRRCSPVHPGGVCPSASCRLAVPVHVWETPSMCGRGDMPSAVNALISEFIFEIRLIYYLSRDTFVQAT